MLHDYDQTEPLEIFRIQVVVKILSVLMIAAYSFTFVIIDHINFRDDDVMLGECLGGALYIEDFKRICHEVISASSICRKGEKTWEEQYHMFSRDGSFLVSIISVTPKVFALYHGEVTIVLNNGKDRTISNLISVPMTCIGRLPRSTRADLGRNHCQGPSAEGALWRRALLQHHLSLLQAP